MFNRVSTRAMLLAFMKKVSTMSDTVASELAVVQADIVTLKAQAVTSEAAMTDLATKLAAEIAALQAGGDPANTLTALQAMHTDLTGVISGLNTSTTTNDPPPAAPAAA